VRGAGTVEVGDAGRAGAVDVHDAVDALAGPMAIQTPQSLQKARLGGLGVPQSQHATDGGALSRATFGAMAGTTAAAGSLPAPDATASVGRGGAAGVTRESHSLQKSASGWTGVPHMGQADGVSTRALCGPLLCRCNRQSCVASKYCRTMGPRG
jgi:hypothetical protein